MTDNNSPLDIHFIHVNDINYAMHQNCVPVVKSLKITNNGEEDLSEATVRIVADPPFARPWSVVITALRPGIPVDVGLVDLPLSGSYLAQLNERQVGQLTVEVEQGERMVGSKTSPINVLSYDEWPGENTFPELIAAFVTPNDPAIAPILADAAKRLAQIGGSPTLSGYQTRDPNVALRQAQAIFEAIAALQVVYCAPPASFEAHGQKIRTPDKVLQTKLATCLDLAVLFAACAEAAGLHPILVFQDGHAFPAVWLQFECFSQALSDEVTDLTKRTAEGIDEIAAVETTLLCAGKNSTFADALKTAADSLDDAPAFRFFVDVVRARRSHIVPVASRAEAIAAPDNVPAPAAPAEVRRIDAREAAEGPEAPAELTRLDYWQRLLLDLSLRNPLLNFRRTAGNLRILAPRPIDLARRIADGAEYQIWPAPDDWAADPRSVELFRLRNHADPLVQILELDFEGKRLRCAAPENDMSRTLINLFRTSRSSLEENGANTLYLAVGMLVWYETELSEKPRYAPIVLIPVDLKRRTVRAGFSIASRDEGAQVNISLIEMLRQNHGVEADFDFWLSGDEQEIDVREVMNRFRRMIQSFHRWNVVDDVYLGIFSFSKFVMWNDLRARLDALKQNKIVASLIQGRLTTNAASTFADAPGQNQDDAIRPGDVFCPISADSSQIDAIFQAGKDSSFVLHGPPGSGKSQTITNMIASALAVGKTVLFVAEKAAALSVVQRRLRSLGLQDYCLELHSNKSSKKAVLDQFAASLEAAEVKSPDGWECEAQKLADLRAELNAYVEALHRRRSAGFSVFDAIARLSAGDRSSPRLPLDPARVEALTPAELATWRDVVHLMQIVGGRISAPGSHPLRESDLRASSPQTRNTARSQIDAFVEQLDGLRERYRKAAAALAAGSDDPAYGEYSAVLGLSRLYLDSPALPGAALSARNWDTTCAAIARWSKHGRERDKLRTETLSRYVDDVLSLDIAGLRETVKQAANTWFLPRALKEFSVRRRLSKTLKKGARPLGALDEELTRIARLIEENRYIASAAEKAGACLGPIWAGGDADWDAVDGASSWVSQARALAAQLAPGEPAAMRERLGALLSDRRADLAPGGVIGASLKAFADAAEAFSAAWLALKATLCLSDEALSGEAGESGWFDRARIRARCWREALPELACWADWRKARAQALEAGLESPVAALERGDAGFDNLEAAFEQNLCQTFVEIHVSRDPSLSQFRAHLFEDAIERFRALDDDFARITKDYVRARVSGRVRQASALSEQAADSSEMGVLRRELRKQRAHLALRSLFNRIPNLLPRLKPCLLMSPMSVAQYLDPAQPPFDLVIFDEASQMPTCDAVGAIARGREVVVVGDPNQLGPTRFFASGQPADDDIAADSLESILDECLALGMPQLYLKWHYRSRHESLIAFSNSRYYEARLFTFPSADDLKPAVQWRPVNGVYGRGGSQRNPIEAQAVADEVVRRLKSPKLSGRSIGIVTFNSAQQECIRDLLDDRVRQEPDLERFFDDNLEEPVFVKNLENVQGDERDVIIFSVGFGPDNQGRLSMNFGPLNQDGGWRRLNVAVSRARQEMLVFSTLRPENIDLSRTGARGVADLRAFLEYAQRGKSSLAAAIESAENVQDAPFEEQAARELRRRGYAVHTRVGCSGYRIDLAIVDPARPGRYLLGIECDGATYNSARCARDRDKLRQAVLAGLGWSLHRVWSTAWWENREAELERIEAAIQAARDRLIAPPDPDPAEAENRPEVEAPPVANESSLPAGERAPALQAAGGETDAAQRQYASNISAGAPEPAIAPARRYAQYTLTDLDAQSPLEAFYLGGNDDFVMGQIRSVVEQEGPICASLLARRVVAAWGMGRIGSRIVNRIEDLCGRLSFTTTVDGGRRFYWPADLSPASYRAFRIPGPATAARRSADEIAPEELANAVVHVLAANISLPKDDLIRETARLLGFGRVTAPVTAALSSAVDHLVDADRAAVRNGRVVLLGDI